MAAPLKKVSSMWDRYLKADQPAKPRLIGLSVGEVGTGKTHFWLGAPGPIVVQSLDRGLEGVVEPFQEHKDIYVAEYDWSPTDELSQDEAILLRDKFIADFEHAVNNTGARTIVWDKASDVWQLFRYAEFGAPNDNPRNYDVLNQRFRKYVNMPKATDINFGCIEGLKDEWGAKFNPKTGKEGAKATGRRIRQGFSELDGLVHINLFHGRDKNPEPGGSPIYWFECGKARGPGGFDVQEQRFEGLTFAQFATLVFPDTTEEDWQ